MNTRDTIVAAFEQVAAEQSKELLPLTDDLPLFDSGIDSLCLAILVARLEDRFGRDPFDPQDAAAFPVTFGDFVKLYETVAV